MCIRDSALPWPSNLYLKEDATRKTGYTLQFGSHSLPENKQGLSIDPGPYRRRDGYSVGTPLLLVIPGLDLTQLDVYKRQPRRRHC